MCQTDNNTLPTASSLIKMRVQGMDCAKDAAEIERAARSAGVAEGDVKVSTATHVITLRIAEGDLPKVQPALVATGYGFEKIEDGDTSTDPAYKDPSYRHALWIVVLLNLGYGVLEMFGGFRSGSQALKADALDFLGDGAITFLGLLAIGWSLTWRARSAMVQGVFLGLLGFGVVGSTIWRALNQATPDAGMMGAFAFGALIVNILAVLPLLKHRKGDANMRAVWLFSRNDAIGNLAVVIAAGMVAWLGSAWPDLIVAFGIAGLFLHSSWMIVRDAMSDLKDAE